MHKISTELFSPAKYVGEEKAIELIAEAGFDAYDCHFSAMAAYDFKNKCMLKNNHPWIGDDYKDFLLKLKKKADDCGIYCNQSHAPFPIDDIDLSKYLERAIESTAILGGRNCVFHPVLDLTIEENAEIFKKLLVFAHKYNVNIAIENVFNWDWEKIIAVESPTSNEYNLEKFLNLINDEKLVVCVDTGHAALNGLNTSGDKMVRHLKSKVKALHLHDNDFTFDNHFMPFSRNVDFKELAKALKEINYDGEITLEVIYYLDDYKDNVLAGLKNMYKVAKKIRDMVDEN